MKKLLIALACVIGVGLYAQSYTVVTPSLGTQTSVAASQTSNNIVVIDCKKAKDVGVQVRFNLSGAGTGVQTLTFAKSLDGSTATVDTVAAGLHEWKLTANGSAYVVGTTNFPTDGAGYLILKSWANGDGSRIAQNISLKYSVKIGAP